MIPLIELALIAMAYSIVTIILPGVVVTASLPKSWFAQLDNQYSSYLLVSAGFGILWSGFTFLFLFYSNILSTGNFVLLVRLLMDFVLITVMLTVFKPFVQLKIIAKSFFKIDAVFLITSGLFFGGWIFLQHPHTFDSVQLLWTQLALWDGAIVTDVDYPSAAFIEQMQPMFGFSGMIAPLGAFLSEPLVLIAATFKPLLLVLLLACCHYVVSLLRLPNPRLSVLLLATVVITSKYGLLGVISYGKDSIYGILYCVLFLTVLAKWNEASRRVESAVFFATASVTGVIAVPYMIIATGLVLVFATNLKQSRELLFPLLVVNFFTLPIVVSFMLIKPLLVIVVLYLIVAILAFLLLSYRGVSRLAPIRDFSSPLVKSLPLFFIALSAALLPATAEITSGVNYDGSVISHTLFPLDGATGLMDMFIKNVVGINEQIFMSIAILVMVFLGFSDRVEKHTISVIAMPFVAIALSLVHLKLELKILSNFNIWDLIKDVPLWLGGTMFSIVFVAFVSHSAKVNLLNRFLSNEVWRNLCAPLILIGIASFSYISLEKSRKVNYLSSQTIYYEEHSASNNKDFQVVSDFVWNQLRFHNFFVAKSFTQDNYYHFQMFGAKVSYFDELVLKNELMAQEKVGFAIDAEQAFSVIDFAKRSKASVYHMAFLDGGHHLILVEFNGKGELKFPVDGLLNRVKIEKGSYTWESVYQREFIWMMKESTLKIPMTNNKACVSFDASIAHSSADRSTQKLDINGDVPKNYSFDIYDTSLSAPKTISFSVISEQRFAIIEVNANMPESVFPNDVRPISWGLFGPIKIQHGQSCVE